MIKVYKMNDYDGVVAKSKEKAIEWYEKETGISEKKEYVKELDKEEEGISYLLKDPLGYDDSEYILKKILENYDEINSKIVLKGKSKKRLYLIIPFKEIIEKEDLRIPSIICSTEY